MFCSYFGKKFLGLREKCTFATFLRALHKFFDFKSLSLDECLHLILEHHESTVEASFDDANVPGLCIFGVDELLKSHKFMNNPHHPEAQKFYKDFVTAIGLLMQSWYPAGGREYAVMPVVTSLSQIIVGNSTQRSNRSINWIPLQPLAGVDVEVRKALFGENVEVEDSVKQAVCSLCMFLGEHGRLLEFLVKMLREPPQSYLGDLEAYGHAALPSILTALSPRSKDYLVCGGNKF